MAPLQTGVPHSTAALMILLLLAELHDDLALDAKNKVLVTALRNPTQPFAK